MSNRDFHKCSFDSKTILKLEIFRGYVREWLPVFLKRRSFRDVHIYDFFCGPGTDAAGNPGSPLLILNEILWYTDDPSRVDSRVNVHVHFNDISADNIKTLKNEVASRKLPTNCEVVFSCLDFEEAFVEARPSLIASGTANLVIMDQFGVKAGSADIFREIVSCSTTDMLLFVSSSFVRRFSSESSMQKYLPILGEEIRQVPQKEVHRYICDRYRDLIPENTDYHLAPFSIKKGSNIYGIIFGSSSLLGLGKFLEVCWNQDKVTGEADYNIDEDIIRNGQAALFPEDDRIRKRDKFEQDLRAYIAEESPDNRRLYEFVLERGFLPSHARDILSTLSAQGKLDRVVLSRKASTRKNAFYLNWDNYKQAPKIRFQMKERANGAESH